MGCRIPDPQNEPSRPGGLSQNPQNEPNHPGGATQNPRKRTQSPTQTDQSTNPRKSAKQAQPAGGPSPLQSANSSQLHAEDRMLMPVTESTTEKVGAIVGSGGHYSAWDSINATGRWDLGKRIHFGRLEAPRHLVPHGNGVGPDRRLPARSVPEQSAGRRRGGIRGAGRTARANGAPGLPADPGGSARRRGRRAGRVPGPGAAVACDPADRFGRELALRSRRADRGPGAARRCPAAGARASQRGGGDGEPARG